MRRRVLWTLALVAAMGGAALLILRFRRAEPPPRPTPERLQALTAERDRLNARWRETVIANGERSLVQAPVADVMIGIPTGFTGSIIEQVVTGLFGETVLTLQNLKVAKEGEVKAKILFSRRKLGEYKLNLKIHQVRGLLKPDKPTLAFGGNNVGVDLPVRLDSGTGSADIRFRWDSKGLLANVVCGDVDTTRAITGGVTPRDYRIKGRFAIESAGDAIVLRPRFPALAVRIFVDPSEQAWAVVDEVIRDRRKGCEIALNKVDVKEKLAGVLGRGFNVKIPQSLFKPIRLPAGIRRSLEVQGLSLAVKVAPTAVLVAEDRIWYGANVDLKPARGSKAQAPTPPVGKSE